MAKDTLDNPIAGVIDQDELLTSDSRTYKDYELSDIHVRKDVREFCQDMLRVEVSERDVARYVEKGMAGLRNLPRFFRYKNWTKQAFRHASPGSREYVLWFDTENDEIRLDTATVSVFDASLALYFHSPMDQIRPGAEVVDNSICGFSVEKRDFHDGIKIDDYITMKDGRGFVSQANSGDDNPQANGVFFLGDGIYIETVCIDAVYRLTQKPDVPTEPSIYQAANGNIWVVESGSGMAARIYESKYDTWHGDDATYEGLPPEEGPYKRIEV